jgi:glycosyltransferase involved in cell wall biosynthesis
MVKALVSVSVVMPSYNHAKYLSEAIESVLNQSFKDFELIILDDCSRDNSQKIIETYQRRDVRIRALFHKKNMGIAKTANELLAEAKGIYVAFVASDDVWVKSKLERQLAILENNEDLVVWSDGLIIDSNGFGTGETFIQWNRASQRKKSGDIFEELLLNNFILGSSILLKTENARKIRFDEQLRYLNDYRFMLELSRQYKYYFIKESLTKYRLHGKNTIISNWQSWQRDEILVRNYILKEYGNKMSAKSKANTLFKLGTAYKRLDQKGSATNAIFKGIRIDPFSKLNPLYLIVALAGEDSKSGKFLIDKYFLSNWLLAGLKKTRGSEVLWSWRKSYR